MHGESILQILIDAASAADQENKRKPPRAGSVPPRATTPVNSLNHYVPGSGGGRTGVVTPAVRPGSSLAAHSASNKRPRLGDSGSGQRAPLGAHRGHAANGHQSRGASPGKTGVPAKTPTGGSSLPRPVAMPMPRLGTQHHALGHGRVPSAVCGAGVYQRSASVAAAMSASMGASAARYGGYPGAAKKASRARRESFKPRPSVDGPDMAMSIGMGGGRWGGFSGLKEEEEGY